VDATGNGGDKHNAGNHDGGIKGNDGNEGNVGNDVNEVPDGNVGNDVNNRLCLYLIESLWSLWLEDCPSVHWRRS
jgi:hypothetical protein